MPSESTQTGFLGRLAMSASVKKCRVYGLRSKDCESPRTMLVMNSHTMSSMIATDSGSGALASPYPYIISSTAAGHRVKSVRTQSRNSTRVHASWSARNWVRVVAANARIGWAGSLTHRPLQTACSACCPARGQSSLLTSPPVSQRGRIVRARERLFSPRGAPRPVGVAAVAAPPLCIRARGCANPVLAPATARRA